MTDAVGKNDEITLRVEELPRSKQFSGKDGLQELAARAAGAMENQNGIRHASLRISCRLAERGVVQVQFRQRFARAKFEILDHKISFGCGWNRRLLGRTGQADRKNNYEINETQKTRQHASPLQVGNLSQMHERVAPDGEYSRCASAPCLEVFF